MKDNFSTQAVQYAQFRPSYPDELTEYLVSLCAQKDTAWDCGTGNGQIAVKLAAHFKQVFATDISANQMQSAPRKDNIHYKVERAEITEFADKQFDLITVAQAIHWFDLEKFYDTVKRTLKPDGVFAIIGYPLPSFHPELNAAIQKLYADILGEYWDKERKLVDAHYRTIPFPFKELSVPDFAIEYNWHFEQLTGFLSTWSAVQHFIKKNNLNPVHSMQGELQNAWGAEKTLQVTFPVLLRVGKLS